MNVAVSETLIEAIEGSEGDGVDVGTGEEVIESSELEIGAAD